MANQTDPVKKRRAMDRPAELVIITGLSGSGKGSVLKALEDLGYYSVDNLPVDLIPKYAELTQDSATVRAAARVRAALGEPLEDEAMITGSFSDTTRMHMVFAQVPLSGPKGHATLMVNAVKLDGPWQFTTLAVAVESTHEKIDLRSAVNGTR